MTERAVTFTYTHTNRKSGETGSTVHRILNRISLVPLVLPASFPSSSCVPLSSCLRLAEAMADDCPAADRWRSFSFFRLVIDDVHLCLPPAVLLSLAVIPPAKLLSVPISCLWMTVVVVVRSFVCCRQVRRRLRDPLPRPLWTAGGSRSGSFRAEDPRTASTC